jgi:ParB family chromosome partitioning protein
LAQSIREKGLIQPVVLRKSDDGGYELIAGERRWRAAQKAGLTELPAILRKAESGEVLELALVENLQRENLNPVDEAQAYKLLLDASGATQEAVAARIGKSRVTVANALRLLTLSPDCLESLRRGEITPGHARALLAAPAERRPELLRSIVARGLSVREAEDAAKRGPARKKAAAPVKDPDLKMLESRLARILGNRVKVAAGRKKGSGQLVIRYETLDDLDRLIEMLEKLA